MVRILHLADLHLGWSPEFLDDQKKSVRREERDSLLERAVDFACKEDIDLVLIVGDLFEIHKPDDSLADKVIRQIGRLKDAGIHVVTVPGNHDEISYHNSIYRQHKDSWPGVLVQSPQPELVFNADIRGTHIWVYSLAYTGGITPVKNLAPFPRREEPGLHIGAFHGTLDGDLGERSLPLRRQELAQAGYHYLALGHLHKHQVQPINGTLAVYPGAVEHKTMSDPGVGHFTVVQFAGETPEIEKIPQPIRAYQQKEIDVSTLAAFEELFRVCRELADTEVLLRLKLKGTPAFEVDTKTLTERLRDYFFHLEIKDETDFIDTDAIKKYQQEHTIRGQFIKRIAKRLTEAENDREKKVLNLALLKGLAAFRGGEYK